MDEKIEDPSSRGGDLFLLAGAAGAAGLGIVVVVALVLGREGLAAIAGFGAIILLAGANSSTTWSRAGSRWNMSETEFENLVEDVERQGSERAGTPSRENRDPHDKDDFGALVREALDELPAFMQAELRGNLAVVISDEGTENSAYGLYFGGTAARGDVAHHISIYRDTLLRDFGDDPDELRRQVTITVRHELAHHLGANESRVRDLGL